ncbi:YobI family P-loop NTPase, partial [Streptococcus sanguinis]|uniref:YobI family P-loop NTPase n=1 Tax=Streptococcus sanguinis TaxID=1305 RepID=UPI00406BD847
MNRKRKVCGESKLVFFYLVKDDLLESQERTKFFDFIIPVVPVVTTSNSYDKLIEILEDMELGEGLDEKFLFNISLYLDDMRLINNICNEYLTYKESLSTPKLNPKKVFSMIVYKNIFPKDFSLLQKNQGYLYELLHSKDEQLEERKNELSEKIQLLEKEIENAQTEQLRDEVELYGLNFQIPEGKSVIEVNGKSQAKFSSYHEFIMELLKEDSKITSFSNFYDAHYNQSSIEETLDSVFPNKNSAEFQERLKNTKNKRNLPRLNDKLKSLQNELYELDRFRLSDVYESSIQIENFDSLYSESIKENPQFAIIPFLIRNTYIDETYQDYLTYFYDNKITKEEKEF